MTEMLPMAQAALGYLWQWTRAPKAVPNWLGYGIFAGLATGIWIWLTPNAVSLIASDWRAAISQIASMVLAARGSASFFSDTKAAPKTDSLR